MKTAYANLNPADLIIFLMEVLMMLCTRSKTLASSLVLTLLLHGCGGGSSPTGAPNTGAISQIANGVVSGFGSVFVDGVEIEDANASVVTENADGTLSNSVLKIGQRVRVNHDGKGTASEVIIDAAVIGSVSAINTDELTLKVAGQNIRINNDLTIGTLTEWGGGYTGIADVAVNDLVEVHGNPVYDTKTQAYKVVATRIQKMVAISSLKINGKVMNLDTTAKKFTLNGLTVAYENTAIRPTGASLSNDLLITLYGPTSALSGTTFTASNLKVNRMQDSTDGNTTAQLGGLVSLLDSSTNTFEVQGVKVAMGPTTTINPLDARVANNAYVKVSGTLSSDSSILATNIQVRVENTSNDLAKIKLKGVISDFVDAESFMVRGIPVDASTIDAATACPGVTLANDVPVQITAAQQPNTPVVLATSLSCRSSTDLTFRPVDGVVSTVDSTAKTFVLTSIGYTPLSVQWSDSTTFVGVTAATLNGRQVRVDGYTNAGALVARVVSVPATSQAGDDERFQRRPNGDTSASAWQNYRTKHRHN